MSSVSDDLNQTTSDLAGNLGTNVGVVLGLGLARTYVALAFWGWFVVPLGVPALTFAHAFGLVLLVNLVRMRLNLKPSGPLHPINWRMVGVNVAFLVLAWGIGWLVSQAMP